MKLPKSIKRGDLVLVSWNDITSDVNGDPDEACLTKRKTPGYFYERRGDLLVIAHDADKDKGKTTYCGSDCYPTCVVSSVRKLNV